MNASIEEVQGIIDSLLEQVKTLSLQNAILNGKIRLLSSTSPTDQKDSSDE